MSDSAIIRLDDTPLCIYTKWYGTFDDIEAFARYARLRNFGTPDIDASGITSLIQVMANCVGDGFGVEIMVYDDSSLPVADNGTFVLEGWEVVDIQGNRGSTHELDGDLLGKIIRIDSCQPPRQQLGEEFIRDIAARPVTFSGELSVGDVIWDRGNDSKPVRVEVTSFGDSGYPYVKELGGSSADGENSQDLTEHYAREHFGKFLGNPNWYAKIRELSHSSVAIQHVSAQQTMMAHVPQMTAVPAPQWQSPMGALSDMVSSSPQAMPAAPLPTGVSSEFFDLDEPDFDDLDEPDDESIRAALPEAEEVVTNRPDDGGRSAGFEVREQTQTGAVTQPMAIATSDETVAINFDTPVTDKDEIDAVLDSFKNAGTWEQTPVDGILAVPMIPYGDELSDELNDTGMLQMVNEVADSEVVESDISIVDTRLITDINGESIVMVPTAELDTIADSSSEGVLAVSETGSIPTEGVPTSDVPESDTSRLIIIPPEVGQIGGDFTTEQTAKHPSPYPEVLDADFAQVDNAE